VTTATVKSHLVIKLKNHHWSKPEQIKDEPSEAVASKAAESEEPMKVEENPKAKSKPDNFVIVHLFPVVNIFEAIDRRRIFQSHNTKEKYNKNNVIQGSPPFKTMDRRRPVESEDRHYHSNPRIVATIRIRESQPPFESEARRRRLNLRIAAV